MDHDSEFIIPDPGSIGNEVFNILYNPENIRNRMFPIFAGGSKGQAPGPCIIFGICS